MRARLPRRVRISVCPKREDLAQSRNLKRRRSKQVLPHEKSILVHEETRYRKTVSFLPDVLFFRAVLDLNRKDHREQEKPRSVSLFLEGRPRWGQQAFRLIFTSCHLHYYDHLCSIKLLIEKSRLQTTCARLLPCIRPLRTHMSFDNNTHNLYQSLVVFSVGARGANMALPSNPCEA